MPVTGAENPLDQIKVFGTRLDVASGFSSLTSASTGASQLGTLGSIKLKDLAFVSPGVPLVIEEIIATAARPAAAATIGGAALTGGGLWLAGMLGVGLTLKAAVDSALDTHFDNLYRDLEAKQKKSDAATKRAAQDATLATIATPSDDVPPQTETAPQVAPIPVLPNPDVDPWVMVPLRPAVPLPTPNVVTVPDVAPLRPTVPEPLPLGVPLPLPLMVPLPTPATIPQPSLRPFVLPVADPLPVALPLPLGSPVPSPLPQPFAQPIASPLTRVDPTVLGSPQPDPVAQPFAQPEMKPDLAQCPPCVDKKQEREDPRAACFKKLVKEGLYPSLDTEFEWVEIDCVTGREL